MLCYQYMPITQRIQETFQRHFDLFSRRRPAVTARGDQNLAVSNSFV
jgi:hypothetical protein